MCTLISLHIPSFHGQSGYLLPGRSCAGQFEEAAGCHRSSFESPQPQTKPSDQDAEKGVWKKGCLGQKQKDLEKGNEVTCESSNAQPASLDARFSWPIACIQ